MHSRSQKCCIIASLSALGDLKFEKWVHMGLFKGYKGHILRKYFSGKMSYITTLLESKNSMLTSLSAQGDLRLEKKRGFNPLKNKIFIRGHCTCNIIAFKMGAYGTF